MQEGLWDLPGVGLCWQRGQVPPAWGDLTQDMCQLTVALAQPLCPGPCSQGWH